MNTKFAGGVLRLVSMPADDALFTRDELAAVLTCALDRLISYGTLAQLTSRGDGPEVTVLGGKPFYRFGPAMEWFQNRPEHRGRKQRFTPEVAAA